MNIINGIIYFILALTNNNNKQKNRISMNIIQFSYYEALLLYQNRIFI